MSLGFTEDLTYSGRHGRPKAEAPAAGKACGSFTAKRESFVDKAPVTVCQT